jgi:hypothetical protein
VVSVLSAGLQRMRRTIRARLLGGEFVSLDMRVKRVFAHIYSNGGHCAEGSFS